MKTERIRLSRKKDFKLPPGAINAARPGPWGNPFIVGVDGTQAECVRLHLLLLAGYFCLTKTNVDAQKAHYAHVKKNVASLIGKQIACWCAPDKPCHVDNLIAATKFARLQTGGRVSADPRPRCCLTEAGLECIGTTERGACGWHGCEEAAIETPVKYKPGWNRLGFGYPVRDKDGEDTMWICPHCGGECSHTPIDECVFDGQAKCECRNKKKEQTC